MGQYGDFYDAFALDDEHICLGVGDVSGKGMLAALFMVRIVRLLRMRLIKVEGWQGADIFTRLRLSGRQRGGLPSSDRAERLKWPRPMSMR